ncbi:MAG: hypothetical protein IT342_22565 [Candidatus Melainabacteria bacterium]|nr:hypothetical protein [Candidatus Melainabacteria bacterium]
MTNTVIALCAVASRRLSACLLHAKKNSAPEALKLALLFVCITTILPTTLLAATAAPKKNSAALKTALRHHQDEWNKANPFSKKHDGQPRPDSNCDGDPVVHQSRPAPDRTMQRFYIFTMPPQKQDKKNEKGKQGGNKGHENNYTPNEPKFPPSRKAINPDSGIMSKISPEMLTQIGGAPNQQMPGTIASMMGQAQGAGDASHNGSLNAIEDYIPMIAAGNVNVANEAAGGGKGNGAQAFRPLSTAIGMVQAMYKRVYLPMALLLLLPGVVILNMKVLLTQFAGQDEDAQGGPFSGILRGTIALFLIPATQLIMSYSIDVGNSMTMSIAQQFSPAEIVSWARGMQEAREEKGKPQDRLDPQPFKDQIFQMAAGIINMSLGYGLVILAAFQLALSCYLLFMGPVAASLYAWPGSVGKLFKPVFINWVNSVVTLSLWRFWWVLIVFVFVTRIHWLQEIGEYVPNTEWEAMMLVVFLVMMMYVPFAPFEVKPGEMVDKILDKAKEISSAASGKKGGAG